VSLRARLTAAFVLVVSAPLATVAVLLGHAVPVARSDRARQQLGTSAGAVTQGLRGACGDAQLAAADIADGSAPPAAVLDLRAVAVAVLPDAGVVGGRVVGDLPGVPASEVAARLLATGDCRTRWGDPLVARHAAPGGEVLTATPLAGALLGRLRRDAASPGHGAPDVTLLRPAGGVVATSLPAGPAARLAAGVAGLTPGSERTVGDQVVVTTGQSGGLIAAVSLSPGAAGRFQLGLALLVVVAAMLAGLLGRQLARLVTRPLVQLGQAASRIAAGELDTPIDVPARRNDEIGTLATAVREMTTELQGTIHSLESSRDELRRNLGRLGDTLASTHDLNRILTVILETALASVNAGAGALLLTSAVGNDLYVKVAEGLDGRVGDNDRAAVRVPLGAGVLGGVYAGGEAVRGETAGPGALVLDPAEPRCRSVLAAPLRTSGRITGVLGLYDRTDGTPFTEADLATIRTFATSAGVAIDNVLLHQEAQRLSITDGLTGLWNYRYLSMALAREVERATRFARPLAVMMLDLDRFKLVNDVHGHQRGDAVLVEVATRVKAVVREVDVLARYGGEELVVVLPETDLVGAQRLAGRIVEEMRHSAFGGPGEVPVQVTVSVGVALHPEHGASAAALLRAADEALYAAKSDGRDCWRVAAPPRPSPATGAAGAVAAPAVPAPAAAGGRGAAR